MTFSVSFQGHDKDSGLTFEEELALVRALTQTLLNTLKRDGLTISSASVNGKTLKI